MMERAHAMAEGWWEGAPASMASEAFTGCGCLASGRRGVGLRAMRIASSSSKESDPLPSVSHWRKRALT